MFAEPAPIILSGKVLMKDGTPPTKTVSIEKTCSDSLTGTPGPLTNKKGEYVWRMMIDVLDTQQCRLQVNSADYTSTQVNISGLNGHTTTTVSLDTIILSFKVSDPYQITTEDGAVPGKSRGAWKTALANSRRDMSAAETQMQQVVTDSPKFAPGWHALGVLQRLQGKDAEARKSLEQAVAADPKFVAAYVILAQIAIKQEEWGAAAKASDDAIAQDKKVMYPEEYLHLSVAKYHLKDMAGAEAAVKEALTAKNQGKVPRAEYVLGRIMVAKGDVAGGREHMAKYLQMEPDATDRSEIQTFMQTLDKPGANEPALEVVP
ncbi:MAG: tetratricopeptide repeat protein [Acidobacteriota bacterium]